MRKIRILLIIMAMFSSIFIKNINAEFYEDVYKPDNAILNPIWEEYNSLPLEEQEKWEVIPEKLYY